MKMKTLVDQIEGLRVPYIVGISGFGGSGKSTLARELSHGINAPVVGVDSFVRSLDEQASENWEIVDFDELFESVILPFKRNESPLNFCEMDWQTGKRDRQKIIENIGKIIVEGVGLFRRPIIDYLDFSIWINLPLEESIAQGKLRDKENYQRNNDEKWDGIWKKNDLEYFERERPMSRATLLWDTAIQTN